MWLISFFEWALRQRQEDKAFIQCIFQIMGGCISFLSGTTIGLCFQRWVYYIPFRNEFDLFRKNHPQPQP